MTFNAAAVTSLFDQIVSHAAKLALFETVNTHEPKNAPGQGLWAAIWVQAISPVPRKSGLTATSGRVELRVRIGASFITEPQDSIDPAILTAVSVLMGEYSGNFTLGGTVIDVDLMGADGAPLSAQAGYVQIGQQLFRVMELTVPVIIDAMWQQGA